LSAAELSPHRSSKARTRVKICGITRVEVALAVVDSGADAIGLVFYERSPRAVSLPQARAIADELPPFVTLTGLFVNAGRDTIEQVLDQVPLGLLQFHGDETPAQCEGYRLPYIKAIRMRPGVDLDQAASDYPGAAALLLDAYSPDAYGGTGECFAWERIPTDLPCPIVLAGGLDADNVADAVRRVHPYAVDVSGGVEAAKGIKDADQVRAFVAAVRSADALPSSTLPITSQ
jgi:phosphoribosylanthranilate isomerase